MKEVKGIFFPYTMDIFKCLYRELLTLIFLKKLKGVKVKWTMEN